MIWIPFEEYKEELRNNGETETKHSSLVVKKLQEKYPSGKEWLLDSTRDKRSAYKSVEELNYILFWAWRRKIYFNQEFKRLFYIYLEYSYSNGKVSTLISKYTRKLNLITTDEYQLLKSKDGGLKGAIFLSLFLMKPFATITDDELDETPFEYKNSSTKKKINDFRLKLGYTNKIVRPNRFGRSNWATKLFPHPLWGAMFKEYHDYLISANAKKSYMSEVGLTLCCLLEYLETHSLDDCSQFTWVDFKKLTEYIRETRLVSTTAQMIAKLKKFFLWGTNENGFFPKKLDFPESYWKSLNKESKEYSKRSNGRAFRHNGIADEIVKTLINFEPKNEEEQLCLYFWSIIVSCPARFSYVLNIEADTCFQRLPNEPTAFGLYSKNGDKSGTKGGQVPFVDKLGINAVTALQKRAKIARFKPIYNDRYDRSYVHLFQISKYPWVLDSNTIWGFFNKKIRPRVSSILEFEKSFEGGAHAFRHHILTEILKRTGSLEAAQVAGGHKHSSMTEYYIKSKHAKKALLFRAIDKYESGEITGKFYLRLIEALTTNEPTTELIKDLTKELTMDEFIKKHGRKTEMGMCFDEDATCANYLKCWNCPSFLLKRDEIEGAVELLRKLTFEFIALKTESKDFSYKSPVAQNKMTPIALIKERLMDLKIPEEKIVSMIFDN